jgi:hypothetical protein
VLDNRASNLDGFLSRDSCVSSTQLHRPIWKKSEHFITLKILMGQEYCAQKPTQLSQGYNVLDTPPSDVDSFVSRDTCVSSNQMSRPTWNKMSDSPP